MTKKNLTFFVTLNKLTGEIILQEGALVSLKIPKHWQKADTDTKNPALWVCHLPKNSLGISQVSFYPVELIIKKKKTENKIESEELEDYEKELEEIDDKNLLTYKGALEPNGENEKESFYRCKLWLQKEKEQESSSSGVLTFFVVVILIVIAIAVASNIK